MSVPCLEYFYNNYFTAVEQSQISNLSITLGVTTPVRNLLVCYVLSLQMWYLRCYNIQCWYCTTSRWVMWFSFMSASVNFLAHCWIVLEFSICGAVQNVCNKLKNFYNDYLKAVQQCNCAEVLVIYQIFGCSELRAIVSSVGTLPITSRCVVTVLRSCRVSTDLDFIDTQVKH